MSLVQRDIGPYGRFLTAVKRIDELVYARIDAPGDGDSILDLLKASGATREELRDQLVTLLAAGHETTATALAWALERLARHPLPARHDDAHIDAFVKEVLRTRPVLTITARKTLQPYELKGTRSRPASTSRPACTSRTAATGTSFRPQRFLTGAPEPFTYVPFGGGNRRCLGAAFADLELREVLRAVARAVHAQTDAGTRGTDAPPQHHPRASARSGNHPRRASVRRRDVRHVLSP